MRNLGSVLFLSAVVIVGAACDDDPKLAGRADEVRFFGDGTGLDAANVQEALTALAARVAALESENASLRGRIVSLETGVTGYAARFTGVEANIVATELAIGALEEKTASLTAETVEGQPAVVFTGVNVHVRNGLGATATKNAVGNLVVGYNENVGDTRTGSHNLVVGRHHTYTEYGGFVGGEGNTIDGEFASVLGGASNHASGSAATVSGGGSNHATGIVSAVAGGSGNQATNEWATAGGGRNRTADGTNEWVAGSLVEAN